MHLPFKKLTSWQQITFAAALLERMLPNYQMFAENVEFGKYSLLRNQLDLIWQKQDPTQRCKINYDAQLLKLEEQIPEPAEFDFFGVYPALDAVMALMSTLQGMQDRESETAKIVSKLSENSVTHYLELLIAQEEQLAEGEEVSESQINNHPLMLWEVDVQKELSDLLLKSPEKKSTIDKAKSIVLEEGLSNLGIERS